MQMLPHPCLQRIADREAQEEWELQQAQEKAMDLHHFHIDNSNNRCALLARILLASGLHSVSLPAL